MFEMASYRILGACNPKMAYSAIGLEPRVGAMLPCNVILAKQRAVVEVSAVEPGWRRCRLIETLN